MDEWLSTLLPIGGSVSIVAFAARWIWYIERDVQRRVAVRIAEGEKRIRELEEEVERLKGVIDKWRDAYYDLRAKASNGNPRQAVRNHTPPEDAPQVP